MSLVSLTSAKTTRGEGPPSGRRATHGGRFTAMDAGGRPRRADGWVLHWKGVMVDEGVWRVSERQLIHSLYLAVYLSSAPAILY